MANERSFEVVRIWQTQSVEAALMTLHEIRKKSDDFERAIQRRDRGVFVVCITIMVCFSVSLIASHLNLLQRIGALLSVLGGGYLAYQIRADRVRAQVSAPVAGKIGHLASLEFYRRALERERDFYQGISLWSRVIVLAPGLPVLCLGEAIAHPNDASVARTIAILCTVCWAAVIPLSLRRARNEQRKIEELDTFEKER